MIKQTVLFFILAIFAFISCQNNTTSDSTEISDEEAAVIDMHTSQTSLDWSGTYEGTLPCADCPGIKVTLVLNEDNTYTQHLHYMERIDADFTESGTIVWHEDGNTISLVSEGNEKQLIKVRDGSLLMLNADGEEITSSLKDHFVLTKKN